jgi:hypothetical protein
VLFLLRDCFLAEVMQISLFVTIGNTTPRWIVWRNFDGDAVTGEDLDIKLAHTPAYSCENRQSIIGLYAKHGIGQGLFHHAFEL